MILKEITTFITSADLLMGIVAHITTVNHHSRHVVTIFFHSIYLEHNFPGKSLSSSILKTFLKFVLDTHYMREYLTGITVDGQYIN